MKLEYIEIRSLEDLDGSLSAKFSAGTTNFITGPNASGKSSIVRAVRAVLFPETSPGFCEITTRWKLDGKQLEARRQGDRVYWYDSGTPVDPPALPGAENAGAYLISPEDLATPGSTEAHISGRIRTLLAGGYDLDAIRVSGPLQMPALPRRLHNELADKSARVESMQEEYARLREELDHLADLKHALEKATLASGKLAACKNALVLADTIAGHSALEKALRDNFPPGMDRLAGDELERLDRLDKQIAEREQALSQGEKQLADIAQQLRESPHSQPQALEALQARLARQRDHLRVLEERVRDHSRAVKKAAEKRQLAAAQLGVPDDTAQVTLTLEQLNGFETLVRRLKDEERAVQALKEQRALLNIPDSVDGSTFSALQKAHDALKKWLDLVKPNPLVGVLWGGLTLFAALAGWRLFGSHALPPVAELLFLLSIAVGAPAALLVRFFIHARSHHSARRDFLSTGVEEPLGWTQKEGRVRLERLKAELENTRERERLQKTDSVYREQLGIRTERLAGAREQFLKTAESLGLGAEARLEKGFFSWARLLHDWQQAEQDEQACRKALEHDQAVLEDCRTRAGQLLTSLNVKIDGRVTSELLARQIDSLIPRARAVAELHSRHQGLQRRSAEIRADIDRLQQERRALFSTAGLEKGSRQLLAERLNKHRQWFAREQEKLSASIKISELEKALNAEPELLDLARRGNREALSEMLDELTGLAENRDDLARQITALETRHAQAIRQRELAGRTAQREEARAALASEFDRRMVAVAGHSLIDDIRMAHQADNEPDALKRAGRWLERFTGYRYQLHFDSGGRFKALDTRDERTRPLEELSTATRAQLMLAVRLAWLEQAEGGRQMLPVFMDEVLTTSDPDRYLQVVKSVHELIENGRQMFYLTAQENEAGAWENDRTQPPVHIVDMTEVRRGQRIAPVRESMPDRTMQAPDIPDPNGLSALQWAEKAGVEAINPWQKTGALQVFHLLHDDLELAALLMRLELSRVGALEAFLASQPDTTLLSAEQKSLLTQRCQAARLILDDWRERHHRPVDEAALQASGEVSETFMPQVTVLAQKVDGDPRALIEALRDGEVPRFRTDKTAALEAWLADEPGRHTALRPGDEPVAAAVLADHTGLDPETAARLRTWITDAILNLSA